MGLKYGGHRPTPTLKNSMVFKAWILMTIALVESLPQRVCLPLIYISVKESSWGRHKTALCPD